MSDTPDLSDIGLYAVRNKEGKWFRAKGYGGYGETWVSELKRARIYNKIGPARATVSYFANEHPKYGIPDIVQFVVTEVKVLDETARVEKQRQKKAEAEARYKEQQAKCEFEQAQKALEAAPAKVNALKGKAKK